LRKKTTLENENAFKRTSDQYDEVVEAPIKQTYQEKKNTIAVVDG